MIEPLPENLQIVIFLVVPVTECLSQCVAPDRAAQAESVRDLLHVVVGRPGLNRLDAPVPPAVSAGEQVILVVHAGCPVGDHALKDHGDRQHLLLVGLLLDQDDLLAAHVTGPEPYEIGYTKTCVDAHHKHEVNPPPVPVLLALQHLLDLPELVRVFDRLYLFDTACTSL